MLTSTNLLTMNSTSTNFIPMELKFVLVEFVLSSMMNKF